MHKFWIDWLAAAERNAPLGIRQGFLRSLLDF